MTLFTQNQQNQIKEALDTCKNKPAVDKCVMDELSIPSVPKGQPIIFDNPVATNIQIEEPPQVAIEPAPRLPKP